MHLEIFKVCNFHGFYGIQSCLLSTKINPQQLIYLANLTTIVATYQVAMATKINTHEISCQIKTQINPQNLAIMCTVA